MKTESKHTPGPWTRKESDNDILIRRQDDQSSEDSFIAIVPRDGDSDRANARLIAAAPDLLSTAKDYLEVIRGDNSPEAIALRAAIAKATEGKP